MENNHIKELHKKRNSWVQTTKENNFDGGIYKLLTELYPDNAHFIYELLQNAEDTDATEVAFELTKDELIFTHNGRPFNKKDIEGITSIGQGTKADDVNKIGKFGVGFKAVFSYTSSPQIFSGNYKFEINDLVVPHELKTKENVNGKTIILFPFNNPDKPKEKAFNEIKKGLIKLHDNTLLFLSSIKKIEYKYEKISNTIERENVDDVRVIISNDLEGNIAEWLRFKKYLPKSKKLFVSVAYRISEDEKTKKEVITPIVGEVSIFFPAEKETSNLKFHLHAPFASTVARDSIKDLEENNKLRDLIAELSCESLEYIKNNQLLDFNFLKCLPIDDDNIPAFYKPIQNSLIIHFNEKDYIQTDSNGYKPASRCYRSSRIIKKVIDIEMLKLLHDLSNTSDVYWMKNPAQINTREDKFLQQLQIQSFDESNLFKNLEGIHEYIKWDWYKLNNYDKRKIKSIFESKDNAWVKQLYELLYDIHNKHNLTTYSLKWIIKLDDGLFNYENHDCFFDSGSDSTNKNFKIVHNEVFENNPKRKNQKSRLFLENVGVKNIDIKEEIELILEEFYSNSSNKEISKTRHLNHWRTFIKYYRETSDSSLFGSVDILLNNQYEYTDPSNILIDEPFKKTNLKFIDGFNEELYLLNDIYERLGHRESFIELIIDLEANISISINKTFIYWSHPNRSQLIESGRESYNTINNDYEIENLDELFEQKSVEVNKLVWNTLLKSSLSVFKARYRRIKTSRLNTAPSSLVYDLWKYKWISDKKGDFYKPQDISKEMLHDDFIYDNTSGWLTAIKFGENILKNQEEYKQKEKLARDLIGIPIELLESFKKSGATEEDFKNFIDNFSKKNVEDTKNPNLINSIKNKNKKIDKKEVNIDPDIINDIEDYTKKAQEQLEKNINKSTKGSKVYNSSYKVKVGKKETKEFLQKQYKSHCQVCGFTFDLKDNQGKYFEVYDWLSGSKANIVEAGSSLCLCAKCHSAMKHGDFNADFIDNLEGLGDLSTLSFEEFTDLLDSSVEGNQIPEAYDFIEMDMYKTPIRLLNKDEYLFFSEEHFLQFYNMMSLKEDS